MAIFVCNACGTSFPDAERPPERCPICEDGRQFVPAAGQQWTRRDDLPKTHRNAWLAHESGLLSLQTVPEFGIGQRAFVVRTPAGNILWDCVALLDQATETLVRALGGLHAIAISHPHFHTTMQDWAAAFDAPVHLHEANREWVVRPDRRLRFWSGETLSIAPDATLVRVGGHFPGSTVLHWSGTEDRAGALLPGDAVQIAPGGRSVSFLWSYPNMLPLPSAEVGRIAARLDALAYDRIYGIFDGLAVGRDARAVVEASAARYRDLLDRPGGDRAETTSG